MTLQEQKPCLQVQQQYDYAEERYNAVVIDQAEILKSPTLKHLQLHGSSLYGHYATPNANQIQAQQL